MANTLTVSGDGTYAGIPLDVDLIQFTNAIHTAATATFATTDFNGSRIHVDVAIEGTAGGNHIVVDGGSLDASAWTFTGWNDLQDSIRINGSAGVDAITGSLRADTITGGLEADTLVGGGGNDTFVYNSVAELVAGETIAGGIGTGDALRIAGAGSYDFRIIAAPGGIERLEFDSSSGGSTARFNSTQFGGAEISNTVAITGDGNSNLIVVHTLSDAFFSAAGWTFTNWSANDNIQIFGTAAAETIIGSSSQGNIIRGEGGADILTGGASDDLFSYQSASDIVAGETVNGQGGTDEITLGGGTYDFSQVTLTSIEQLKLAGTATLTAGQIGSGAITLVDAGLFSGVQAVIVNGALVDLSAVTFASWTTGQDTITINGTAGNDSLTGSNQFDTLNGGLGNDTYGLGADNNAVNDDGGVDTITSTASRDLSAFAAIENLTLLGAAANGTGNGLANILTGNAVANVLDGGAGDDSLFGGDGGDRLIGGLGVDLFTGGAGADTFAFTALTDSGKKPALRDTILDFTKGDFIDLSVIDAKQGGIDNAFKFIKQADFHDKKGELHFTKKSGDVLLSGDVDGNGKADFSILLADLNKVVKGDFVL